MTFPPDDAVRIGRLITPGNILTIVGFAIAGILAFFNLEGKVDGNAKDILYLGGTVAETRETLKEIGDGLSGLHQRMTAQDLRLEAIEADIKVLLIDNAARNGRPPL